MKLSSAQALLVALIVYDFDLSFSSISYKRRYSRRVDLYRESHSENLYNMNQLLRLAIFTCALITLTHGATNMVCFYDSKSYTREGKSADIIATN